MLRGSGLRGPSRPVPRGRGQGAGQGPSWRKWGQDPRRVASRGTANIQSASDKTQSQAAGGGGLGLHKQPRLVKLIKAAGLS